MTGLSLRQEVGRYLIGQAYFDQPTNSELFAQDEAATTYSQPCPYFPSELFGTYGALSYMTITASCIYLTTS